LVFIIKKALLTVLIDARIKKKDSYLLAETADNLKIVTICTGKEAEL